MQWMNNPKNTCVFVASSLYETRLQGIMIVAFIIWRDLDEYSYHYSLQACIVEGTDHSYPSSTLRHFTPRIIRGHLLRNVPSILTNRLYSENSLCSFLAIKREKKCR